jgi:hypothetical protein
VKGYFLEGSGTLHWILKKDAKKISTISIERNFLLSPHDKLSLYLRQDIKEMYGTGYLWTVFKKGRLSTAFRARVKNGALELEGFKGDMDDFLIVKRGAAKLGLRVIKKIEETNDDELMDWMDRHNPPPPRK